LYNIQTGVQIVQISSSVALTDAQKAQFMALVSGAINKQVQIEESVDESLIGGYVLKVGDTQIDTSVKKKLNELKLALA
jgi:F-type H+-transporting ATPase subunit delta